MRPLPREESHENRLTLPPLFTPVTASREGWTHCTSKLIGWRVAIRRRTR